MFEYILYRTGQFIALALPLKLAYRLATFFSDVHYIFANIDRRNVLNNLKAIFPEKSEKELVKIRLAMFRNFAKYLVDFFRFSIIDRDYIGKNIKIEGRQRIDEALSKEKGVITLTAHLGNWELGGAIIGTLGYPFWVVARTHKDKKVNDFFNAQRESKGIKVIPLGKAGRQCYAALKENKILGLVGDRDFNENGVIVDFFGKKAHFPEGPAYFSLRTGAVILPGFMLRNEDDTFTLKIEEPIHFSPSGNIKKDMEDLINNYKKIIEDYVRRYPDQWYMFRKFWIE